MSDYSNIIFDSNLLDSDFHKNNLKIASLNLKELNTRLDSNHKIIYLQDESKTEPSDSISTDNIFISDSINYFINWSNISKEEKELWVDIYLNTVENRQYEPVIQVVTPKSKINDKNRNLIFSRFFAKKERFIKIFKGFYPLGFLETNQEELISDKLSYFCTELDDWVK
ncbi:hypothetical protein [Psychroflexus montanilacus]|uniref:hypothetical protein n=1 Tax=Psychroflexus montanilacus TaxID=2873598 RepID=UPI001CCF0B73|nr:hypothetical protein [Psychroflexus montanilacus]MBZ9651832.1 hypothetical protein [Psychroflexus montanilacus]